MEPKQAAVINDAVKSADTSVAQAPSSQQSIFHDAPFHFLQRVHDSLGNRATGRWLQAKLRVGAINDPYEREADAMADRVMRMPQSRAPELAGPGAGHVLQRCSCGTCSSCRAMEDEHPVPVQRLAITSMRPSWIQREATETCSVKQEADSPEEAKEDAEAAQMQPGEEPEQEEETPEGKEQPAPVQPKRHAMPAASPDNIEERLNASRGQGEPLALETRQRMEDRFGYDFSRVRIHNASYAHRLNQDLNALAFTTGTDIYFAPSQFQPSTTAGQHLLAHELTHVVQQAGGSGGMVREKAAPGMISRSSKPEDKHGLFGYYRTLVISGEYVHYRLERILRNTDEELVTEAAIPGADRFGPELNKIGVADLYKSEKPAKTVTGVKGYQPVENPKDIVAMDNPTAVGTKPGVTSLPTVSGKRDAPIRTWTGDFPAKIKLGEIKPLSASKVAAGLFQLDSYDRGYKAFVERISKISRSTRPSIDVERLKLALPAFLNFDNWDTQHSIPEKQTTIAGRRLWVADVGSGLYVYFDIDSGLPGPPLKWEKEVAEMRKIKANLGGGKHPRTDRMDPLVSGKFLPGGPRLAPPRSTSLPGVGVIQRSTKDRPDGYWKERGREWEESRSKWGKGFRSELKTTYRTYNEKLKIEKRLGRSSRSAPSGEKTEVREYKQLMFWSGLPGRFLGKVRFLLGTAWDKIIGIFERMKERMHDLRKKISGTSDQATFAYGWRKTLIKILVKAAKAAVIKFITESFNFFVQCFESAMDKVWEKMQGELHERLAEELCQARKFFEESKQRLEDDWGISFDKLKELLTLIQDARHWVDVATGLIQVIRLGVQVISCLTPPALGCLWGLVAQIGIGTALDLLIGTQWFNDHILSPTIGDLVSTYATPFYQKLINRALGENLKEYHCHIADDKPSSSGFGAVDFNDGLREGSPELLQHRDNWEAQNRDAMVKDLQVIFQKGKGRKVTPEELQQLAEEVKKGNKTPEETKKLLEAERDPLTGRLKIEVARENVKRGELPQPAEGEVKERKTDYPYATRRNKEYQGILHWDPMTFYKKPGVAVDSEEFADAVYDMQEALHIDKDGIVGEQTLLAFYDRNKLKPDAAYEAATKLKEEKQAAREKAAKEKEEKLKGKEGDLVAIGVPKPPPGTEIKEPTMPYGAFPFGTSEPDIKLGETHAPGEPLTVNASYWIDQKWVWFTKIPVKFNKVNTFTLPGGKPLRYLDFNVAEDFYFKLAQDATIAYIFSKGDRILFLDPGYYTILAADPATTVKPSPSETPPQKLQRKLRVGATNDQYEQEADHVADRVMRMALPPPEGEAVFGAAGAVVQRECSSCGEEEELQRTCAACAGEETLQRKCEQCEEEEKVQRKCEHCEEEEELQRKCSQCEEEEETALQRLATGPAPLAPPIVHGVLGSPGQPLDTATRAFMEPRFGQDFSDVRVHTGEQAARSARSVNALAYTVGPDVVFAANRYAPEDNEGRRLLAHELAHVVQQSVSSRLPATAAGPPSPDAAGTIRRTADISQLPAGLPCVTITEPGHPAGVDLMFGFVDTSLNAAHTIPVNSAFTGWVAGGSTADIAIDGFASTGGIQKENWQRSCDRAENAKAALVARGVPATKITTFAHGESNEYGAAMPPNDRAVIHTTAGLPASELKIDSALKDGDTSSIFFDRGSSTVIEPSQLSKIAPLAATHSAHNLTLFGFVSEDENVPAATGTALALARITEVSSRLGAAGHGKAHNPDTSQTGSGAGQIGYRDMRKVVVKVAGGASGVSNCGAGSLIACSPAATFTDAQKRAAGPAGMLEKAIGLLSPPILPANKGFLHDRFGTTPANEASIADIVKTNLTKLKPHVASQMTPVSTLGPPPDRKPSPGHRCANNCDGLCSQGASAYNNDQDGSATMTLCDTPNGFMKEADLDKRAAILIHEGLHGITLKVGPIAPAVGPDVTEAGATDFAYQEQRLIKFLDPLTALNNNDSYVVLIFQMLGLPITIGRATAGPGADVVTAGAIPAGQRPEVDQALAWLEGWLVPASLEVSSLYDTIKESIPAGTWKNSYYQATMSLLAPRFGLTMPPSLPAPGEQFKVAAIQERLERMSDLLYNTKGLSINRVNPGATSWTAGPAAPVIIGDDFFAMPAPGKARAQLELLLRTIIKATTGVSADAAPRYADLVNQIRIHLGIGGP